jgi:hypothetical protein
VHCDINTSSSNTNMEITMKFIKFIKRAIKEFFMSVIKARRDAALVKAKSGYHYWD